MKKCYKCETKALVYLPQYRIAFCKEHYIEWYLRRLQHTIDEFKMFKKEDKILVAVSGGKDSLSLLDALYKLGYEVAGFHIYLGIGDYSEKSRVVCEEFAKKRSLKLYIIDISQYLASIPKIDELEKRPTCSFCGQIKRYYMNSFAKQNGYNVVATGHNLDDESTTLLLNILNWNIEYLIRQKPVLSEGEGFVRKVKPLLKFTEKENAIYALFSDINYIEEECPFSKNATSIHYKKILSLIEEKSPGTKLRFYLDFLRKLQPHLKEEKPKFMACTICGEPTVSQVCSFCKLKERLSKIL